jgi:hypothetical protein
MFGESPNRLRTCPHGHTSRARPFPWRRVCLVAAIAGDAGVTRRLNEVDLLVLGPAGLILVEIKSRPGTIEGDAHSWNWTTDGHRQTVDNPLLLANRKAKRLASLLKRQAAFGRGANRAPWGTPGGWSWLFIDFIF